MFTTSQLAFFLLFDKLDNKIILKTIGQVFNDHLENYLTFFRFLFVNFLRTDISLDFFRKLKITLNFHFIAFFFKG